MNGAQLVYLRDISDVTPNTQMELRQIALANMYPSMTAHLAASMKLGDMRDVIEQLPYEELLAQWNRTEADTLSSFFKETAANYTDDPNQVDLYQGYRISDLGQLDDLASSCRATRHIRTTTSIPMSSYTRSTCICRFPSRWSSSLISRITARSWNARSNRCSRF